jgi:hypothetical protein
MDMPDYIMTALLLYYDWLHVKGTTAVSHLEVTFLEKCSALPVALSALSGRTMLAASFYS